MTLEPEICYRALEARDPRFDGLFFVGVKTTGIYCRCVCPARTPFRKNVNFYGSPAEAEADGFRPCLRCRPETAPGRSSVDVVRSRARKAARLIETGGLDEMNLDEFAAQLGVSERQLRRAMKQELGVGPAELAQTHRLLNAKRLLTDTRMPVGEVALASGYSSLRRFNASFRERYNLTPTDLRKRAAKGTGQSVKCELFYRPPFDWDFLIGFLGHRRIEGVEWIDDGRYSRTTRIGNHGGWLTVTHQPNRNSVSVELSESLCPVLPKVLDRVRRLFDLDADPAAINGTLGELACENPGTRLPGAFDGFEAITRAIVGQQVSVKFATTLAGRIADAFGGEIETHCPALRYVFPGPEAIADCTQDDVAKLGIIGSRARAIIGVAQELTTKRLLLNPAADYEATKNALVALPGLGPWTAEYVAMRALSYPDAFPAGDLGVLKALGTRNQKEAQERAERYRPWRAYAAIHMWRSLAPAMKEAV